ncbi:MAG: hypothetical protein V3U50_06725 [Acidimicrobiia bacterium]
MIEEARRLPPSMLAVGIAFISLFVVLALGTIVAVMADDTPQVPDLEGLPIIEESEVVDSISTCTEAACDGYGVLLMGIDLAAPALTGRLVRLWRSQGWRSVPCLDEGGICFAEKDLRISVRDWGDVDPVLAPTLVEGVADRDLDAARLLYVHYYRCGAIYPCE